MAKKMQLGYREIELRLADKFGNVCDAHEVGYALLYSFGKGERDIERYKEGKGILKNFDGLLIKGLICYKTVSKYSITEQLELLKNDEKVIKAAPEIIAVSDGNTILAYDLNEKDTYENQLKRLPSDFAFFYPLMGVKRVHYVEESPADVKAAEKLAKLHDELRSYNEFRSDNDLHDLNIFISRLLFCFFAEDTGIFEENLFTSSIQRYTKEDGSDLSDYLASCFNIMDVSARNNDTLSIIKQFPYVNGGLFSKHIQIPKMGAKARKIIIECGELDWKDINPDIFGSMIQAVVNPEERANQGMHYTSVPNIMKVINPLFLDELREEYNKLNEFYEQRKQLFLVGAIKEKEFAVDKNSIIRKSNALLARISKMKFFDPACGSGNFLIITYKCLRFLEIDILALQRKCLGEGNVLFVDNSVINLSQFYGIELLDFPHEVAMLSLWLAEHQMNTKLNENFGVNTKALPLKNITQIVCGNACRLDWNEVCPHTPEEEVFIFGNPPYLGSRMQSASHKSDVLHVIGEKGRSLDYICCWFVKAADYIDGSLCRSAFVSTNSICQGEQVSLLWKPILQKTEITFAYTSFKWTNNAKHQAAVICVIIGLKALKGICVKRIYSGDRIIEVENINPYLTSGNISYIERISSPISIGFAECRFGSMANDGGNLVLDKFQVNELILSYPILEKCIKKFIGSYEFINCVERWCLYIEDKDLELVKDIPPIASRLNKIKEIRSQSTEKSTRKMAEFPYKFYFSSYQHSDVIIIPATSSENREYIPIGYLDENTVVSNSAYAIYNASLWNFGVLTAKMHMLWVKTVGGKLKTDYRYSSQLIYNTFPFPKIPEDKKKEIETAAENVLITRENYPEKTLAELYDPNKMPKDLLEAHKKLDDIVESCYPGYPFASDEARLECLFKLYEKMTTK